MAFIHGKNTKVLVNQYDLSAFLNNTDMTWEVDTPETTTYGNDDRVFIGGLRGSTLSFSGFYDATSATTVDAIIPPDLGNATAKLLSYATSGFTVGNRVYSVQSFYTNYTVSSPVDGVVGISLDTQGTGKLANAISLHNLTAVSSDGNSTAVDQLNSSLSGGVGYLHITAIQGLGAAETVTMAVQDSPSCTAGVWADVVAFTAISCNTPTAQRVAATGGVDRYVRGEWDFSGASTGIATFTITFDRL